MWKAPSAAVLSALLLAGCGRTEPESLRNGLADAEANGVEASSPAEADPPQAGVDGAADPVPPPDAVSHPDGYLPPAPDAGNGSSPNPSGADEPPPATEDEYIRNGQAAR